MVKQAKVLEAEILIGKSKIKKRYKCSRSTLMWFFLYNCQYLTVKLQAKEIQAPHDVINYCPGEEHKKDCL